MRTAFLLLLFLAVLGRTVGATQAGVLGWTWLTLMTPHQLSWGFITEAPLNLLIAIVTLLAWFMSREPKRMPLDAPIVICVLFIVFVTFTTFFALAPDLAWPRWNLAVKVMILGLVVASVMITPIRIHALVWVIVLSLGYYGVKGGLFTILTAGQFRVLPAPQSVGDNNTLAVALCMVLPLMNYLRLNSGNRFVRIGSIPAMGLTAVGVLGTYSRGGVLGLTVMGIYLWWKSKNRFLIALIALVIAVPAYTLMPSKWTERMATIETASADTSFQTRLHAWQIQVNIAMARPFIGGGFNASQAPAVHQKYNHDASFDKIVAIAAHSIYFEVLGDHGFIGLVLYLLMLWSTWRCAGTTRRLVRREPQLRWVGDLTSMIQRSEERR